MKILFLTRRFWPEAGGVERHTFEIAKRLVNRNHQVVVVTETLSQISNSQFLISSKTNQAPLISKQIRNSKFGIRNKNKFKGIDIYRIPVGKDDWFKKWRIWKWLWKNRNLIKEADIIHAHDVGFWYWPFRMFYPSKPFFITFHGWEGKFPVPLKNKIVRKISEKMAKGNICVGDYIKKWYGTKTDFVTYGGVEKPKTKYQIPKTHIKNKKIVFIGRLEKDTGLPIYLEALNFLKYSKYSILYTTYYILFLGDGPLKSQAEKYGKVLGFVKDIRPYILKSRFVFTSGYLSILEAIACKRLVFSVYDNLLKEDYLKMSPFAEWIIMERNPKGFVDKTMYYTGHLEEEKELVDKAYDWVKTQSWEKVMELYLRLWKA